jgi:hypothetical protein
LTGVEILVAVKSGQRRAAIVKANATSLYDDGGRRWSRQSGKLYGAQEWLTRSSLAAVERALVARREAR